MYDQILLYLQKVASFMHYPENEEDYKHIAQLDNHPVVFIKILAGSKENRFGNTTEIKYHEKHVGQD